MKTHERYEFFIEETGALLCGSSPEEVFSKITDGSLGATSKTKGKMFLEQAGISARLPDMNGKEAFFEEFFNVLRDAGYGCWKWFDSLPNTDCFRFDTVAGDYVRRFAKGRKRVFSDSTMSVWKANIEKSHEARRQNHELAVAIARKANSARKAATTPEQKAKVAEKCAKMRRARLEHMANFTEEEKLALSEKRRAIMKAYWERRHAEAKSDEKEV